jgi:hypothetical protein
VTDADVAALGPGLAQLAVEGCARLTPACLAPLRGLRVLHAWDTPQLGGAGWAGLPRLLRVSAEAAGPVTDAHLPALARCTHVRLRGAGVQLSDAGVGAHLSRVCHLDLELGGIPGVDGGVFGDCLRRFTSLRFLGLACKHWIAGRLRLRGDHALAGSAASLRHLRFHQVDVDDDALGTLRELTEAFVDFAPLITDAGFREAAHLAQLSIGHCGRFTGDVLLALQSLAELHVVFCPAFTGAGLAGLPRLQQLHVTSCEQFTASTVESLAPRLTTLSLHSTAVGLTDTTLAAAHSLTNLVITNCASFTAAVLPPGLKVVSIFNCASFTGTGVGGLRALLSMHVDGCSAAVVRDVLAAASAGCPALGRTTFAINGGDDEAAVAAAVAAASAGGDVVAALQLPPLGGDWHMAAQVTTDGSTAVKVTAERWRQ